DAEWRRIASPEQLELGGQPFQVDAVAREQLHAGEGRAVAPRALLVIGATVDELEGELGHAPTRAPAQILERRKAAPQLAALILAWPLARHDRPDSRHLLPKRAFKAARTRSTTSGGVAPTRVTSAATSSPLTGTISSWSLSASARKPGSCMVSSKARRSAAARAGGSPGGAKNGRPYSSRAMIRRSACRSASVLASSIIAGTSGRSGCLREPHCAMMRTLPSLTQ